MIGILGFAGLYIPLLVPEELKETARNIRLPRPVTKI